jgi:solute carrier family 31 (copper transporter), member 1
MFSTGPGTPLYSPTWIPVSEGNYAGTCLFLVVLAFIFRALVSLRSILKRRAIDTDLNSRYTIISRRPAEDINNDPQSPRSPLKENIDEDNVIVVRRPVKVVRPWKLTPAVVRSVVDVVTVGVVYLLWAPFHSLFENKIIADT